MRVQHRDTIIGRDVEPIRISQNLMENISLTLRDSLWASCRARRVKQITECVRRYFKFWFEFRTASIEAAVIDDVTLAFSKVPSQREMARTR